MTTICATANAMAADSRVTWGDTSYLSPKLLVLPDAIVGAAGDSEACRQFLEWWPKRETADLDVDEGQELDGLVLTRTGLYLYGKTGRYDKIRDGMMAIGSGGALAIASLETQIRLGFTPCPKIAVEVACMRNPGSAGPIDMYTLDNLKKRK